ncbi:MAG: soluble lytic murein transglycosylase [Methylophagaceae bacterium]|jgi:soluble lytic murein transglycosylase
MSILKSVVLMILMLGFSAVSLASDNTELVQQRTIFQQAKKALQTHQLERFNTLRDKLNDYPLQPYLDYLYLQHRLHLTDNNTIRQFVQQNSNTFYGDRLRNSWLEQLAKNKQWSLFLNFLPTSASTSQQCLRLDALIATGKAKQASADTPVLWLVGHSQDKNCDSAFKYWQAQGFLTNDLRWQRIRLTLQENQFSMAKYLARSLDKHHQAHTWIPLWQQSHNQPLTLLKQLTSSALKKDQAISREIIKHAIERLSRKSTDQAYAYWQTIQHKYQFTKQDKNSIQSFIANRAALNREQRTLEYFGDLPNEQWRVRAALWQQDWAAVQKAVLSLSSEEQASTRWQYWLGRSQAQLGNKLAANHTFQNLIMQRDYYAFLAADQLGQPYQMNHRPIVSEQAEFDIFSELPAVARLREFYIMGMHLEARRQAYQLKESMSPRELQLLATLTHQWQWHNQTIALLGKAQYWDALDLRFPIIFDTAILKASKINGVDPSWLFGIARRESAFNPHARSPVGASGLMQLMPKTATQIARLINQPLKSQSELLNPDRNIQLGSAYLRRMYDQNQRNPVLATASYNAGPHRVSRWLPEKSMPADVWIENIPYNETRAYATTVLSYAAIFDYQRKQPITPLSDRMPAVKPKTP